MTINKQFLWGLALMMLGCLGVYNAINDFDKIDMVREDVRTTGYVTEKRETVFTSRRGFETGAAYTILYAFTAADGTRYTDEQSVKRNAFHRVSEGDSVTVYYHSTNPRISGLPALGTYITVDEIPHRSPIVNLLVCSGFVLGGLALMYFSQERRGGLKKSSKSGVDVSRALRSAR